jgi:hypothetical protein
MGDPNTTEGLLAAGSRLVISGAGSDGDDSPPEEPQDTKFKSEKSASVVIQRAALTTSPPDLYSVSSIARLQRTAKETFHVKDLFSNWHACRKNPQNLQFIIPAADPFCNQQTNPATLGNAIQSSSHLETGHAASVLEVRLGTQPGIERKTLEKSPPHPETHGIVMVSPSRQSASLSPSVRLLEASR